jgi:hypothetical protein
VRGTCVGRVRAAASASAGDGVVRITHAATRSEYVDYFGMPSRVLLGGGNLGTATNPLSHGEGHGDHRIARLGLSGALFSPAFHLYHGPETLASR